VNAVVRQPASETSTEVPWACRTEPQDCTGTKPGFFMRRVVVGYREESSCSRFWSAKKRGCLEVR
jgi:hypothetical protein